MSPRVRQQKLTVYLLREDVTLTSAMRESGATRSARVPAIDQHADSLFVVNPPAVAPAWRRYLEPHVDAMPPASSASSGALLLISASDRLFAIAFGQGRHLIDPECIVPDFGLKVVLNTVEPSQLKSVDARTIDDTILHTRRDVSRDSNLGTFGLDLSRDLLRAVTGTPRDRSLAKRLTGSDALGIHTVEAVPALPTLMGRLLDAYSSTAYRENFDFIDHLRPVKSRGTREELNERLVADIRENALDDVHLAVPETVDWLAVEGFGYSSAKHEDLDPDPRISRYLGSIDVDSLTTESLKRDRVIAIGSSNDSQVGSWPVYRCLVYQVELDACLYVLSAGDWYRVDVDYRKQVEADVRSLPEFQGLPPADAGDDEKAYNIKAADHIGGVCMDRELVRDGADSMEVCDILTPARGFIHVKQRGSSSTLSHLFAQGTNSAERLMRDPEFRTQAKKIARRVGGGATPGLQ